MASRSKPIFQFLFLTLTLLLLLSFFSTNIPTIRADDESSESDDLEQLLALDEEDIQQEKSEQVSEAEVLSKAQRIVLELDGDNTKRIVNGNEFVMILGYAPWCARSAELMPKFAEAATRLKEMGSKVVMAKVDGERFPKVASQLDIKGFPTLLLFVNGSSMPYTGGFLAEDIVMWTQKKTGVPVIRISTVDEAEGFLKEYHTFVVGLFDKLEGPARKEFVKAATADDEIQFVETSSIEVAKLLFPDIKNRAVFIGLVKSEHERYTAYEGPYETEKMLQFLENNKFPLVTKLTETNSVRVYSGPVKLQVMVFANADDFKNLTQPLEDIARKFKSKIMFIYIDIANENLAMPFLTLFGMEESGKTVVVAAFDNKDNSKFLLESNPSPSNIEEFSSGLLHGTVLPYYKSQPIPDNSNASVLAVVGKTFDELILNNPKNVLLEVYTPWCLNCETMSKQIEKLAKHFKGLESLVFTRIDAATNEHPKLEVDDYPAILFYKAGEKDKPIKISTKSSSKDMAIFINKQLKATETKDEL